MRERPYLHGRGGFELNVGLGCSQPGRSSRSDGVAGHEGIEVVGVHGVFQVEALTGIAAECLDLVVFVDSFR